MRHEGYWELRESPFRNGRNPNYFFASPTHEEALARLQFLAGEQRSLGIVSGGDGSGKSFALQIFGRTLRHHGRSACVINLFGLDVHSFDWALAAGLGTNPRATDSGFALWRQVGDRLRESRYTGEVQTLLLDDVDLASQEVRIHVLQLLKTRVDQSPMIILAAASSRLSRLGPDLLQLCELHIRLEAWDPADVRDYLHTSLTRAGRASRVEVFDESAVARLHEVTDGVPRRVCQLAELALVAGAGRKLERIDADTIDAVAQELSVAPPITA
ncbi:MAG: hypothetical protein NTY19_31760 [Planctomycetota bacterium]|nr:hypothetical protein [Planctomycetota bacterium]